MAADDLQTLRNHIISDSDVSDYIASSSVFVGYPNRTIERDEYPAIIISYAGSSSDYYLGNKVQLNPQKMDSYTAQFDIHSTISTLSSQKICDLLVSSFDQGIGNFKAVEKETEEGPGYNPDFNTFVKILRYNYVVKVNQ